MAARFCTNFVISVTKINILQRFTYCTQEILGKKLDRSLLDILVCPLSKEPLRYDEENNKLINDKLNVAYPIHDGIPILNPHDAQLIKKDTGQK